MRPALEHTYAAATPTPQTIASLGTNPVDIAAADLDGSGIDDLVVALEGGLLTGGGGLEVLADGGAAVLLAGSTGTSYTGLELGDADGDGDLALARGGTDTIHIYANDGTGALSFTLALPLTSSGLAATLCSGDLDADGDLDLAAVAPVLLPTPQDQLTLFLYSGSGSLTTGDYAAQTVATAGALAVDLACGDFENDSIDGFCGRLDLVVVNAGTEDVEAHLGFDATTGAGEALRHRLRRHRRHPANRRQRATRRRRFVRRNPQLGAARRARATALRQRHQHRDRGARLHATHRPAAAHDPRPHRCDRQSVARPRRAGGAARCGCLPAMGRLRPEWWSRQHAGLERRAAPADWHVKTPAAEPAVRRAPPPCAIDRCRYR
ncbi:MAG: FG-GAP-like repeat-containing protein [Planctomycetota bacterium]